MEKWKVIKQHGFLSWHLSLLLLSVVCFVNFWGRAAVFTPPCLWHAVKAPPPKFKDSISMSQFQIPGGGTLAQHKPGVHACSDQLSLEEGVAVCKMAAGRHYELGTHSKKILLGPT